LTAFDTAFNHAIDQANAYHEEAHRKFLHWVLPDSPPPGLDLSYGAGGRPGGGGRPEGSSGGRPGGGGGRPGGGGGRPEGGGRPDRT
jgi:hypothetical protein